MRDGAVVARRAHNPKVIGSSPVPATYSKGILILEYLFLFRKLDFLRCLQFIFFIPPSIKKHMLVKHQILVKEWIFTMKNQ